MSLQPTEDKPALRDWLQHMPETSRVTLTRLFYLKALELGQDAEGEPPAPQQPSEPRPAQRKAHSQPARKSERNSKAPAA